MDQICVEITALSGSIRDGNQQPVSNPNDPKRPRRRFALRCTHEWRSGVLRCKVSAAVVRLAVVRATNKLPVLLSGAVNVCVESVQNGLFRFGPLRLVNCHLGETTAAAWTRSSPEVCYGHFADAHVALANGSTGSGVPVRTCRERSFSWLCLTGIGQVTGLGGKAVICGVAPRTTACGISGHSTTGPDWPLTVCS